MASATTTIARKRKRCPQCRQMIEVGEPIVLTDDRHMDSRVQWHGRSFRRGAWHSWHPACKDAALAEVEDADPPEPDDSAGYCAETGCTGQATHGDHCEAHAPYDDGYADDGTDLRDFGDQ